MLEEEFKKLSRDVEILTALKSGLEISVKKLKEEESSFSDLTEEKKNLTKDIENLKIEYKKLEIERIKLNDILLSEQERGSINSWNSQRDSLLSDISTLTIKKEEYTKKVNELSDSYTEISEKLQKASGVIEEIEDKEKVYKKSISKDILSLEKRKTELETIIPDLKKEIDIFIAKKESLERDIMFLIVTHEDVFSRTGALEKIVEHVTSVNSSNMKQIETAVSSLKNKVDEILSLSAEDLMAHKNILNDIPKLFVELQRKSLQREIINKK